MTHRHPRDYHAVSERPSPVRWLVTALVGAAFLGMVYNGQRCLDGCDHLEHTAPAAAATVVADANP